MFGIPAYNEERTIRRCIISIQSEVDASELDAMVIVCVNGCTDRTEAVIRELAKTLSTLRIVVITSERGKIPAINAIIDRAPDSTPIFLLDADSRITRGCVDQLLLQLQRHPQLRAVGALPLPEIDRSPGGRLAWKQRLLNSWGRNPRAFVTKQDVRKFHAHALTDPAKTNTDRFHEPRSKIYLHGAAYMLRDRDVWCAPPQHTAVALDDAYFCYSTLTEFGPGSLRLCYDAVVMYTPISTFRSYSRAYRRNFFDMKRIVEQFPELKPVVALTELKLSRKYLRTVGFGLRWYLICCSIVWRFERAVLYPLARNKNPCELWQYAGK